MNNTLNNLALLSFERKAKKLGANVIDATKDSTAFSLEYTILKDEVVILWSFENAFQEICNQGEQSLCYALIDFADKYKEDKIFHFGVYNPEKKTVVVFRQYDQLHFNGKVEQYDLKFAVESYLQDQSFYEQQESELPFLQTGRGSWL